MPEKKTTDWKAVSRRMNLQGGATQPTALPIEPWDDTGRVVLEAGKRKSRGNDDPVFIPTSRSDLLGLMEYIRKRHGKGTNERVLKGLFGGGEKK